MYTNYDSAEKIAGKGLHDLFIGEILSLFFIVPLIGTLAAFAGGALSLYAMYLLTKADNGYRTAFALMFGNFILKLLSGIFAEPSLLLSLTGIAGSVLNFMTVYFICNTTAGFLSGRDDALAERASFTWKIYLFCSIANISAILFQRGLLGILASLLKVVSALAAIVGCILYLNFLWNSQKILSNE